MRRPEHQPTTQLADRRPRRRHHHQLGSLLRRHHRERLRPLGPSPTSQPIKPPSLKAAPGRQAQLLGPPVTTRLLLQPTAGAALACLQARTTPTPSLSPPTTTTVALRPCHPKRSPSWQPAALVVTPAAGVGVEPLVEPAASRSPALRSPTAERLATPTSSIKTAVPATTPRQNCLGQSVASTPGVLLFSWQVACIDNDAQGFLHWGVQSIPAAQTSIAENGTWQVGAQVAQNGFGALTANGWAGPCPPDQHNYQIVVTATLDDNSTIESNTLTFLAGS